LSGRGLCDELITRPEESYRLWCVVVCDLETSRIGAPYRYDISCLRVKLQTALNFVVWNFEIHPDYYDEVLQAVFEFYLEFPLTAVFCKTSSYISVQ